MEDGPICPSFHVPVLGEEVVQHSQCGFQVTVDNVCIENKKYTKLHWGHVTQSWHPLSSSVYHLVPSMVLGEVTPLTHGTLFCALEELPVLLGDRSLP